MNVLPFAPTALQVTAEWLTNLHLAHSGEKRDQLRLTPRVEMQFEFTLSDQEVRFSQTVLDQFSDDMFMPDWRYEQHIAPVRTVDIDFQVNLAAWPPLSVGDSVLFYRNETDYHIFPLIGVSGSTLTIADVPSLSLVGWTAIPLYPSVVRNEPTWNFVGNTTFTLSLTLVTDEYPDLTVLPATLQMFNGSPILARRDYATGSPRYTSMLPNTLVAEDIGAVSSAQIRNRPLVGRVHTEVVNNQREMLTVEHLFHQLAGRAVPFFKPSHLPDFVPTSNLINRSNIVVAPNPQQLVDDVRFVYITRTTGETVPAQVASVSHTSNNLVLTLSSALTFDPTDANISSISMMELSRLDTDVISMVVGSGITTAITLPTREVNL